MFINNNFSKSVRTYKRSQISKLSSASPSLEEQARYLQYIFRINKDNNKFKIDPWAWVKCFHELANTPIDKLKQTCEEMPASIRTGSSIQAKRCPVCGGDCALNAPACPACGYEFPVVAPRVKPCPDCGAANPLNATVCQTCGAAFATRFTLTLDEALRTGAIVRGLDLDETEVRASEALAPSIRTRILQSGDEKLVNILKILPEESYARLRDILL